MEGPLPPTWWHSKAPWPHQKNCRPGRCHDIGKKTMEKAQGDFSRVFFRFQPLAILLVAMFACLLLVFWYSPGRQFFWLGFWLGRCAFRTHPECFSSKRRALQMNPKCTAPKPEAQPKKLPAWDVPKHKQKASKCPNQKNCQRQKPEKNLEKSPSAFSMVFCHILVPRGVCRPRADQLAGHEMLVLNYEISGSIDFAFFFGLELPQWIAG